MAGFELFSEETRALEKEIERLGVVLKIDWSDEAQVRALAREALAKGAEDVRESALHQNDYQLKAKAELFGLAALMFKIMEKSAEDGIISHGGPAWKAFGRALWNESSGS